MALEKPLARLVAWPDGRSGLCAPASAASVCVCRVGPPDRRELPPAGLRARATRPARPESACASRLACVPRDVCKVYRGASAVAYTLPRTVYTENIYLKRGVVMISCKS